LLKAVYLDVRYQHFQDNVAKGGVKAAANDAALEITEAAMRVCGGAAFSKALPIERSFRDARAGSVMAPTADALYDFYGRAVTGLPLF